MLWYIHTYVHIYEYRKKEVIEKRVQSKSIPLSPSHSRHKEGSRSQLQNRFETLCRQNHTVMNAVDRGIIIFGAYCVKHDCMFVKDLNSLL